MPSLSAAFFIRLSRVSSGNPWDLAHGRSSDSASHPIPTPTALPLPRLQAVKRHLPVPHAAGIQRDGIGVTGLALNGRPVAEDDAVLRGTALRVLEPGAQVGIAGRGLTGIVQRTLAYQVQPAFGRAVAHAREVVSNHSQAVVAGEGVVPAVRCVAVHVGKKIL